MPILTWTSGYIQTLIVLFSKMDMLSHDACCALVYLWTVRPPIHTQTGGPVRDGYLASWTGSPFCCEKSRFMDERIQFYERLFESDATVLVREAAFLAINRISYPRDRTSIPRPGLMITVCYLSVHSNAHRRPLAMATAAVLRQRPGSQMLAAARRAARCQMGTPHRFQRTRYEAVWWSSAAIDRMTSWAEVNTPVPVSITERKSHHTRLQSYFRDISNIFNNEVGNFHDINLICTHTNL